MKRINFEDGQLVTAGYVKEDGTIEEAVYEGETPLSAFMMNKLQNNIEEAIDEQTSHKYILKLTSSVSSKEITLPAKYKVGADTLDVYFNGERLIKASTADTEGHYYEVGEANSTSNKINIATDWFNSANDKPNVNDIFEFVIRGEYE